MTERNPIVQIVEAIHTFRGLCNSAGLDVNISQLELKYRDMAYLKLHATPAAMMYLDTMFDENNPTGLKIMGIPITAKD